MPTKLAPLIREALSYELRRLVGGRRTPNRAASEHAARASTEIVEAPVPPTTAPNSWASQVLDHAERTLTEAPVAAEPAVGGASAFEAVDLGLLPDAVAHLVRSRGAVRQRDLAQLVRRELMLGPLPANYERLLNRLIWSAKGRRMIELREEAWVAGPIEEAIVPELEGWSLDALARLARDLRDHDTTEDGVFQAMIGELVGEGERAPRIVAIVVGVALGLARRRGYLAYGRWGQGSLLNEPDGD